MVFLAAGLSELALFVVLFSGLSFLGWRFLWCLAFLWCVALAGAFSAAAAGAAVVVVAAGAVVVAGAVAAVSAAKATEDRPIVAATISANTFSSLNPQSVVSVSSGGAVETDTSGIKPPLP